MKNTNHTTKYLIVLLVFALSFWAVAAAAAATVGKITKEELREELGSQNLVILDVRTGKDWKSSEFKIQGAVRANPGEFASWSKQFDKTKKLVLYCA